MAFLENEDKFFSKMQWLSQINPIMTLFTHLNGNWQHNYQFCTKINPFSELIISEIGFFQFNDIVMSLLS